LRGVCGRRKSENVINTSVTAASKVISCLALILLHAVDKREPSFDASSKIKCDDAPYSAVIQTAGQEEPADNCFATRVAATQMNDA